MSDRTKEALLAEIMRQEALLADLEHQREEVRARIESIRKQVATAALAPSQLSLTRPMVADARSSYGASDSPPVPVAAEDKVRIFRDLFRGREDVYPKFWEKPAQGTKGYSPACGNFWAPGICPKRDRKKVKCGECDGRSFLPIDDKVILDHLNGRHVIGVYPMLEDETCRFLAADFDKASWKEDVAAFTETCRTVCLHPAVERSRSGNGAHVWFFFAVPVAANAARRMGCYLITQTMARRHQLGMESYDRLFPNQDTMPRGGFGNLIALPLQGTACKLGNTLFVDHHFDPLPDQWAYLAEVPRIGRDLIENLAREASRKGQVIGVRPAEPLDEEDAAPWIRLPSGRRRASRLPGPLPTEVKAVLAQRLFVGKAGMTSVLLDRIQRLAAFQNPVFYEKQRVRLSTLRIPRVISCAEEFPEHLAVPRGCRFDLEALLDENGVKLLIEDKRCDGTGLDVTFRGELTPIQKAAARAMLEHDTGVLVAPPGMGKTVLGTYLVSQRRRNTLILVHRQQLLDQWLAQLAMFLGIDEKDIGQIGGGKKKPNGRLDVAMMQSLVRKESVDDLVADYGHVIVDECHHLAAYSYERILNEVKARYLVGLTATPQRRDGHHPIVEMQLGPVRFSVDARSKDARRPFAQRLIVRDTGFVLRQGRKADSIQDLYRELVDDEVRNSVILNDVVKAIEEGRSPILLTERRSHVKYFAERLERVVRNVVVLEGGRPRKEREEISDRLAGIPDSAERLILATGKYIGEGFDDARLDTLFLALPISFKGTLVQYTGRLHRLHSGKSEVRIFDYVDRNVPMLLKMFEKRLRGYRAIGYARDESPLGIAPPPPEGTIYEWDEEALRHFYDDE